MFTYRCTRAVLRLVWPLISSLCAELQQRKNAENRKKEKDEPAEHRDCGTQKLCENRCSIYVITMAITRFRLGGIDRQCGYLKDLRTLQWFLVTAVMESGT